MYGYRGDGTGGQGRTVDDGGIAEDGRGMTQDGRGKERSSPLCLLPSLSARLSPLPHPHPYPHPPPTAAAHPSPPPIPRGEGVTLGDGVEVNEGGGFPTRTPMPSLDQLNEEALGLRQSGREI